MSHVVKDGVMTADRWSFLGVHLASLNYLREMLHRSEHTSSEPDSIGLHHVLFDLALNRLVVCARKTVDSIHTHVKDALKLFAETGVKALEQSVSSRKDDVVVKFNSVVDRAFLDSVVNNLFDRAFKVLMDEFRVEEHLRAHESLIADIDVYHFPTYCFVDKLLKVLSVLNLFSRFLILHFGVVPAVFFHEVLADIAVFFLHLLRNFFCISLRHVLFTVLKLLDVVICNVTTS